jgi:putative membrane protein
MIGIGEILIGLGLLVMVLLLVVVGIALSLWLARAARSEGGNEGAAVDAGQDAHEIARRRYARGEITREEYLILREDLEG